MTRKTKRQIEREVNNLGGGGSESLIIINMTATHDPDLHPELSVETDGHDTYPLPNLLPDGPIENNFLFVGTCDMDREHDNPVPACELWDALSEEELKEEKRIREENDDPIPPILEGY